MQAAALGGDLGADGELTVPALLESEDPASVLVVRVRAACVLEPADSARARPAFGSLACTYSMSHRAIIRVHMRSRAIVARFLLPRLMVRCPHAQDEEVDVPKSISPEEAEAAAATAAQGAGAAGGEAAAAAARALADMMGGGLDANAAAIANAAPRARPAWMAGDSAAFTGDQASEVLPCRYAFWTRHC